MKRKIVVTGGSRGIGLGIAKRLIDAGFRVIVVARTLSPEMAAAIEAQPDRWFYAPWDLADIDSIAKLASTIRDDFGDEPLYGLVNNAGIGTAGILAMMPNTTIERIMLMNVISPMILTKFLVRQMMTAKTGRIINISSIVATTGYPGLSAYSASKAALLGFTRSLAREVGALGITVNAVAPGFVDTEMTHGLTDKQREQIKRRSALHAMVSVDDIADAVCFLMSDGATRVTGTTITVDAGNTA
jgi:3-oxoacyl-[acyl-carrier protein] reductase